MIPFGTILVGLGSGLSRALVGYVKNLPDSTKDNSIDWVKAAPALIVGAGIGIYGAVAGIDLMTAEAFLASTGVTYLVGEIYNTIYKAIVAKKLVVNAK